MVTLQRLSKGFCVLKKARNYRIWYLIEAYLLLSKYHFLITRKGYSYWRHHLNSKQNFNKPTITIQTVTIALSKNLNRHILAIVRHSRSDMNCLRRCLTLKTMIERRHGTCTLHIGVKITDEGNLFAHSWVTVEGELVNDSIETVSEYTTIMYSTFFHSRAQFDL